MADIRNNWARHEAIKEVQSRWNGLVERDLDPRDPELGQHLLKGDKLPNLSRFGSKLESRRGVSSPLKVGIIGAGAAGLFTGMIFDFLREKIPGFDVSYEIIEAAGEERVGGRLFTKKFSDDPLDYFDVGAMRFPDHAVMDRTFKLFEYLGMEKSSGPDNATKGSLIPYYLSNSAEGSSEPWCFNNITKWGKYDTLIQDNQDPFEMNLHGRIPPELMKYSPDQVMDYAIEPLREKLKEDLAKEKPGADGWKLLMEYDHMSTREFLKRKLMEGIPNPPKILPPPYGFDTVEWMETFNGGTNAYDQAHSETVLDSLDFGFDENTKWWCIYGGAQELAYRMKEKLTQPDPITYNSRVTAIRVKDIMKMEIDIKSATKDASPETRTYSGIFNSAPLGCIQRMDTSKAGLNYPTQQAIRSLSYGASAKVGIKFNHAWWIHRLGKNNITGGGAGHSDLIIRTCVYPSYNTKVADDKSAVLLCSYTWQQDAQRISALISGTGDKTQEEELKKQIFRDLARLHCHDELSYDELLKIITDSYEDHFAYDWYHDINAMGAFALFRPGQFSNMWGSIIQPSGDHVMIGEAASPHHAWIVGSLESAVHGVYEWLSLNRVSIPYATKAMLILSGQDPEQDPEQSSRLPFIGLPPYMDSNTSDWQSLLGMETRRETLSDDVELLSTRLETRLSSKDKDKVKPLYLQKWEELLGAK